MFRRTCTAALLLSFAALTAAQSSAHHEPALSPAQEAIVSRKIATLKRPAERQMAKSWSNAKKIAEMICRPAALTVLKKQDKSVDRVFLGTDDPTTLTLQSNTHLSGSGEVRTSKGWEDFKFTCEVDAQTGEVTSFQPVF